jgi:hypothetical protein
MIPQAVNVLASSPKGKSRIGTKLTNDPDFRIIEED